MFALATQNTKVRLASVVNASLLALPQNRPRFWFEETRFEWRSVGWERRSPWAGVLMKAGLLHWRGWAPASRN